MSIALQWKALKFITPIIRLNTVCILPILIMYQTFFAHVWIKLLKYIQQYLWLQNSVIKATPTTCNSGPRNT